MLLVISTINHTYGRPPPAYCQEAGLRAAIAQGGVINFPCDTIITLSQTLTITNDVILTATNRTVVLSGGDLVRVFEIVPGASLTLQNITVQNGLAAQGGAVMNQGHFSAARSIFRNNHANPGTNNIQAQGGAIYSSGELHLEDCTLELNTASATNKPVGGGPFQNVPPGNPAEGGSLFVEQGSAVAINCSWLENQATAGEGGDASGFSGSTARGATGGSARGGAVFIKSGEFAAINNTYFQNRAKGGRGGLTRVSGPLFQNGPPPASGGVAEGGAIYLQTGAARLLHATVVMNGVAPGLPGSFGPNYTGGAPDEGPFFGVPQGAGIMNASGSFFLGNSILCSNTVVAVSSPPTPSFSFNVFGSVTDLHFNISSDSTLSFALRNTDPLLGDLGFHNGATKSFSLQTSSPAVDFSDSTLSPVADQRGSSRAKGRAPDCGAFETDIALQPTQDSAWLRAQLANGGSISLPAGAFVPDDTLLISKDATVEASLGPSVFDGRNGIRVFHVLPGVKFVLKNVAVLNGRAPEGGAMVNDGQTTVLNCHFENNIASGLDGASGTNSFAKSQPGGPGEPGSFGRGGAIFNTGVLIATNSSFSNNRAIGGAGGSGGFGGNNLFYTRPGCVVISGQGGGGAAGPAGWASGGAIWNSGSAVFSSCGFLLNSAIGGVGGHGGGSGAVSCFTGSGGTPTDGGVAGTGEGGAVFSAGESLFVESSFYGNSVNGGSGGIGGANGPGSYMGPGASGGAAGGHGGFASGGALRSTYATFMTNVTFANNLATGGSGGIGGWTSPFCIAGANGEGGDSIAGAVDATEFSAAHCTFQSNATVPGAGGAFINPCTSAGPSGTAFSSTLQTSSSAAVSKLFACILSASTDLPILTGPFRDDGYNICTDPGVSFTSLTSRRGFDPLLLSIDFTAGRPFFRPSVYSPARDAVPPALAPATDQRGIPRPVGPAADVGAVELDTLETPGLVSLSTNNTLSLTYPARPSIEYSLWSSTNLLDWQPMRTNSAGGDGILRFNSLEHIAPETFYLLK